MFVAALVALLGWLSSYFLAPETSGMTLDESSAPTARPARSAGPASPVARETR